MTDALASAVCSAMTDDQMPIYRDGTHLNPMYVRRNVHVFDALLSSNAP
jgi:hypothetical protein